MKKSEVESTLEEQIQKIIVKNSYGNMIFVPFVASDLAKMVKLAGIEGQIKSTKILLYQAKVLNEVPGTQTPKIPDYFIEQMKVHLKGLEDLVIPVTVGGGSEENR